MAKKILEWNNVPFKTWGYEKQTEMKHRVFSYYLPLWLRILGSANKNLNYVDGFGGIGAYHIDKDIRQGKYVSNCFGSPIISIQAISDLTAEKKITKANIIIIDEDSENLENIKKILALKKLSLDNVHFEWGDFNEKINEFLDYFEKDNKKLAPTFFLLDPFGISGIRLSTLKRIMKLDKTEILLNFMYNTLQRWISHPNPKIHKIYDEYFGGDEWRKFKNRSLAAKENNLVSIFRKECKKFTEYVYPFRLNFPNKRQTYYYLFHLTNYWLGCSLMKDSFAKFNDGRDIYTGECYQSSLFENIEQKEKREKFSVKLSILYNGRKIKYEDIFKNHIDETDLLSSEIKKLLRTLEKENKIYVKAFDNRKRRGGFHDNDIIFFK